MSSLAMPLTPPHASRPAPRANRHLLPLALTLLVHGLALLALLPALQAAAPAAAPQTVMVGVVIATPTPPAPVQTPSAPPPAPKAAAPAPMRPTVARPAAPVRSTPTKTVAAAEPAQPSAPPSATPAPAAAPSALPSTAPATPATRAESASTDSEPPRYQAAYLNNPQPPYPAMSRKLREQGSVRLHVMVNAAGEAETVRIKSSSGYDRLDQAALAAVRQWRFVPARQRGQAIAGWVEVPIQFHLEN